MQKLTDKNEKLGCYNALQWPDALPARFIQFPQLLQQSLLPAMLTTTLANMGRCIALACIFTQRGKPIATSFKTKSSAYLPRQVHAKLCFLSANYLMIYN
jgi:hypothetical protein